MTSPRLQDVSLYELALSSEHPPQPLQVSPTTFKAMIVAFLDGLIEQRISATLWLKMPKGDVWMAEIDRYRKSANVLQEIYILQSFREESGKEDEPLTGGVDAVPATFASGVGLLEEPDMIVNQTVDYASTIHLPLMAESQLRREYFLLILSEEFSGLVLAHRPRSIRSPKSNPTLTQDLMADKFSMPEEELERKHPLLGLYSFEPKTIERVFRGILQAAHLGRSSTTDSDIRATLNRWEAIAGEVTPKAPDPTVIGAILTQHVQRQEEIWHSGSLHRRQAEMATALRLENEELLNAIRLKDEFLNNVGQELRTPLTTMKTALSLLNSPTLKPVQRQRYMDMLSRECDRQSTLITSVLDLVQIETFAEQSPVEPLRLSDVIPGVVGTYQPLAEEKGIMLAYTVPEDLPLVACSQTALRQVVINLLHNAIKFTPQGGQVWVKAKLQGDYIQIEFRDTGVGIEPTEIPKIFDRFYRVRSITSDESGGVGLGLSIVQQLLLRCGGSVSVKSKINEGSSFTVLLPSVQS
jgi:signal transduction histidine kinase